MPCSRSMSRNSSGMAPSSKVASSAPAPASDPMAKIELTPRTSSSTNIGPELTIMAPMASTTVLIRSPTSEISGMKSLVFPEDTRLMAVNA